MNKNGFFASEFWKNYGMAIICFVLALCILVVGLILKNNWTKQVSNIKQSRVDAVTAAQLEENRKVQATRAAANAIVQEVTGIDLVRKSSDDKLAEAFVKYAVEWDSYDSYVSSRETFKAKYPYMDESSDFLRKFFPPADTLIIRDTSNSIVYNSFDNGRNIHFDSLLSYVISISDDGTYKYFADILCHSDIGHGKRSTRHMVMLYTLDKDGTFSDVSAYVLTR